MYAEQQTPTGHYQSQLPFNLNHNTSTSAVQSPAATDPNVPEKIPTQVQEIETEDVDIDDVPHDASVIATYYQNNVKLQQDTNVQTAAEKQLNDITMSRHQMTQLLQEQQKKIAALEEKVDKISIEQKQLNENFESKISKLQQEIDKMKQKDQNKPLTAKNFKY